MQQCSPKPIYKTDIVYMLTNNVNIFKESRIMQPSKMCKSLNHYIEKQIINMYNDFR